MKSNIKARHSREAQNTNKSGTKGFVSSILIGIAAFLISSLILLLLGALVAYKSSDPARLELPLALTALYIGLFIGGAVTARLSPSGALIAGLCNSALSISLVCLLGIITSQNGGIASSGIFLAIGAALPMLGALASAYAAGRKQSAPKKKNKKHKKR